MIAGVKMGLAVWRAPFFLIAIFARQFRNCAFLACFNFYYEKREKLQLVHQYYPNAITTIDSVNKLIDHVESELDLEPSQAMVGDSICSDGVNSIQYPSRMSEYPGPFKMGRHHYLGVFSY